jgi:hypothetical protein
MIDDVMLVMAKWHSCKEGSKGIPKAGILEVDKLRVLVTESVRKKSVRNDNFFLEGKSFTRAIVVMDSNFS